MLTSLFFFFCFTSPLSIRGSYTEDEPRITSLDLNHSFFGLFDWGSLLMYNDIKQHPTTTREETS